MSFINRFVDRERSPSNPPPPYQENPEDVDEMDNEGQSIIMGIINQLRMGSDLSRITLPTFILERKSMLERITNQLQHPRILLAAHDSKDPVERFVQVVKWYMSGWHNTPKAVKKPLNPVLGEHFQCWWDLPNDTQAFYISEQTSHHPPKSSYFYMSPANHIRVDGTLIPKSKFLGNSAASIMEGIAYLRFLDIFDEHGDPEEYELTQPNMYARGILIGTMKYEMGDHLYVKCPQNDLVADIEFKTKGFISGTYHAIEGVIKRQSTGSVLYEITGKWNEIMEIKNVATGKKELFFDSFKAQPLQPQVRPLEEQGEYESRNLWRHVLKALTERDHKVATDEKFKVEDAQRSQARKREETSAEFHPKLFKPVDNKLEYEIYKSIDPNASVEEQIAQIQSIAPILPGEKFRAEFHDPAFQKLHQQNKAPLDTVKDLKSALPTSQNDEPTVDDSGDEFVDAES